MKQNASSGEQSEAPRRRWKPGQEQHTEPENQDSQHMLNQPRGSFSDFQRKQNNINIHFFGATKSRGLPEDNKRDETFFSAPSGPTF